MSRPSRTETLIRSAYTWAERSTCDRLHVGCVIEREGRILVQGYNGAPAGLAHCNHDCICETLGYEVKTTHWGEEFHHVDCPKLSPCTRAVHAEQNAIAFAARWGVEIGGASLWVTHQPCLSCSMSIINSGIIAVHYVEPYRLLDGVQMLEEAGIKVLAHVALPPHE